ncbi:hypothetical protein FQR65_LT11123 [Abscondita terminalis]|nr:hypothetical protein FQR65_LT11123 [Abscondita terminalis]
MLNEAGTKDLSSNILQNRLNQYLKKHPKSAIPFKILDRIIFGVALGYCIDQLVILKYNCNEIVENEEELYEYVSFEKMFKVTDEVNKQLQEQQYEHVTYSDMNKLQKDICFLVNTLVRTCLEILKSGMFTFLMKVIMGIDQEDLERMVIEKDRKAKVAEIKLLRNKLKTEKAPLMADIKEYEKVTYGISTKLQYCDSNLKLQTQYVTDWEYNRKAQFNHQESGKHTTCANELKQLNDKINEEHRIHEEIRLYIQENINDLDTQIHSWLETYERDVEDIDTKLSILKYSYDEFVERYQQRKNIFEQRARAIQEWNDLKTRKLEGAIKIQRWWREILAKKKIVLEELKEYYTYVPGFSSAFINNSIITNLIARLQTAESELKCVTNEIKNIKNDLEQIQDFSINDECTDSASKNTKKICYDFNYENEVVVVFTDGACENNGRANARAGIGVWFGRNHPLNISIPVEGRPTNNTAEIQACIHAIKTAHMNGIRKLKIKTDSEFVINSMTKWINKWKKNNWKVTSGAEVKNKEDFVRLDNCLKLLDQVIWEHVDAHKGIEGNEGADSLAKAGATMYKR